MSKVRVKIGQTYRRTVTVELPGEEVDEVNKKDLIVTYRDLKPSEQKQITKDLMELLSSIQKVQKGDVEALNAIDPEAAKRATDVFDKVVLAIENLEVVDENEDGTERMLEGRELLDFVKEYKRLATPIIDKWKEENKNQGVSLGN